MNGMALQAFQRVLRQPSYTLLAASIALVTFAMAVWMPNLGLIAQIIVDPGATLSQKVSLPLSLVGSIRTNVSVLTALYTIAIPVLFGVNVAMMVYYLKRRVPAAKRMGLSAGLLGMASGTLGIGCAACGSFILTSALSSFGGAGALFLLPLRGGEFGILGVALLGMSIVALAKRIEDPLICKP